MSRKVSSGPSVAPLLIVALVAVVAVSGMFVMGSSGFSVGGGVTGAQVANDAAGEVGSSGLILPVWAPGAEAHGGIKDSYTYQDGRQDQYYADGSTFAMYPDGTSSFYDGVSGTTTKYDTTGSPVENDMWKDYTYLDEAALAVGDWQNYGSAKAGQCKRGVERDAGFGPSYEVTWGAAKGGEFDAYENRGPFESCLYKLDLLPIQEPPLDMDNDECASDTQSSNSPTGNALSIGGKGTANWLILGTAILAVILLGVLVKSGPAKGKKAKKTRALVLAGILVLSIIAGGLVLVKPVTKGWATAEEACGDSSSKATEAVEAVIPEIPFLDRAGEGGDLKKELQDLQDAVEAGDKNAASSAASKLARHLNSLKEILGFSDETTAKVNDAIQSLRECGKKCR